MARKRAHQRWSALLARIGKWVREALGESLWADFVAHGESVCTSVVCERM